MPRTTGLVYEDLFGFPDDGLRRELLDGELLVSPSPVVRHQVLVGRLHVAIAKHLERAGDGRIYLAPLDVVTVPNVQGAPTLVIEVLSDARRDRILKLEAYARFGVPEYWIVDPAGLVEIHRDPVAGRYTTTTTLRDGDITTEHLPGLEIDLADLFAAD